MARADSLTTTRRSFVRASALIATAAIAPLAYPDAELVSLSHELNRIRVEIDTSLDDRTPLWREGEQLLKRIWSIEPTTLEGLQAKARSLYWIHGDQVEMWDCPCAFSLVEEILAMTTLARA